MYQCTGGSLSVVKVCDACVPQPPGEPDSCLFEAP